MENCILTIIKNEHPYLDEFIRYHLDLGIAHIFVFEDIGSESHEEITRKYGKILRIPSPWPAMAKLQRQRPYFKT